LPAQPLSHPSISTTTTVKDSSDHGWVRVSKIGHDVTEAELLQLFGFCGFVSGVKMFPDQSDPPHQLAIIEFWDKNAVTTACLLSSAVLQGQPIQVELYIASIDEQQALAQSNSKSGGVPPPLTGDVVAKQSKTAVMAQLVARNYLLANDVRERAIAWDTNNLTIIQKLEALGTLAINNAAAINEKYHLSEKTDEFITAAAQRANEIRITLDANPNVQYAKSKVNEIDQRYGISTKAVNLYEQARTSATQLMDETKAELARQQEQRLQQAILESATKNPQ